ncbi:MAG: DUF4390 domain-containing protein [Acidobacteriota bacterium]
MTLSPVLRRFALFCLLLALSQAGAQAKDARISDLLVTQEGSSLLVSFQLLDGLTEELVERIESGLPTGFSYRVRVERPRRWWLNKTVVASELQVVAMYNAITREYLINYKHDGKLIESRVVKSLEDLEREMTIVHEMAFVNLEEDPDARLTMRLRAELGSRTILGFIPATIRTDSAVSRRRTAVWETVRSD